MPCQPKCSNGSFLKFCVFYICTALLLAGCTGVDHINFDIQTPGIDSGTFIIKNTKGETVYGANIKNGSAKLDQQVLEEPGYYSLSISDAADTRRSHPFEVYLEPGDYQISIDSAYRDVYPEITSSSALQKELSDYYKTVDMTKAYYRYSINSTIHFNDRFITQPPQNIAELQDIIKSFGTIGERDFVEKAVIKRIVNKTPKSLIAAHVIRGLDYTEDPAGYYQIYQHLSVGERNSDDGAPLGEALIHLVKLMPGQPAPAISGLSPEGKPFNKNEYKKKIYLVEFWKAGNELSRIQHGKVDMDNFLSGIHKKDDLGIISVSLDNKRDWWTSAIKDDQLSWPQYSDLKGNESENVANWSVTRLPVYFLVDGNWHMLDRDISLKEAGVVINQHLDHH